MLHRNEINYLALNNLCNGEPIISLLQGALGMTHAWKDEWWTDAEQIAMILDEVEKAVAILRRRCDYVAQIEYDS